MKILKFLEFSFKILGIQPMDKKGYTDLPPFGMEALGSFSIVSAGRKWTGFGRFRPKVSEKNICLMSFGTLSQRQGSVGQFSIKI